MACRQAWDDYRTTIAVSLISVKGIIDVGDDISGSRIISIGRIVCVCLTDGHYRHLTRVVGTQVTALSGNRKVVPCICKAHHSTFIVGHDIRLCHTIVARTIVYFCVSVVVVGSVVHAACYWRLWLWLWLWLSVCTRAVILSGVGVVVLGVCIGAT